MVRHGDKPRQSVSKGPAHTRGSLVLSDGGDAQEILSPSDPDRVWAQARGENLVRQSRVPPRFLNYYTVGPEQLFNDAF